MTIFFRNLLILTSLALASAHSSANGCAIDYQQAQYLITHFDNNKAPVKTQLVLWRIGQQQVIHQYPQTQISEYWYKSQDGRIQSVRYFDAHKRAIEYQAGESVHGKQESNWSHRYQLVSNHQLKAMTLVKQAGENCNQRQYLHADNGQQMVDLTWLPAQKLIQHFEIRTPKGREVWELQSRHNDVDNIRRFFAARSRYNSTDFADIGDDHMDYFLTQILHKHATPQ